MLEVAGREVPLSNPAKVYFPKPGWTKLDLVEYYLALAEPALVHLRERPTVMKRFVNGIMEEPIWQKRVPRSIPEWLQTATVSFPSGRTAEELVANDAAHLVWAGQPRRDRLQPMAGAARRPRSSRRAARRPRPNGGDRLGRCPPHRPGRPRGARRPRPARLPEDLRLEGDPCQRADRTALGLPRCAPRRPGAGARGRAAGARPGGSTPCPIASRRAGIRFPKFHRGRTAFEDDHDRDLKLRALGFDVVRLSYRQVFERPNEVIGVLTPAFRAT